MQIYEPLSKGAPPKLLLRIASYLARRATPLSPYFFMSGACVVCGQATCFFGNALIGERETMSCAVCGATSRYRSMARGLLRAVNDLTGLQVNSLAALRHIDLPRTLRVYDTQTPFYYYTRITLMCQIALCAYAQWAQICQRKPQGITARIFSLFLTKLRGNRWVQRAKRLSLLAQGCSYPLPDWLALVPHTEVQLSLYRTKQPLGVALNGKSNLTNQNLEHLTFADATFDIVMTSDVMEHVRQDALAHAEIRRVLKPGGVYLFTVPHMRHTHETLQRVVVHDPDDPSQDEYVLEKEYHGDTNDPENAALSFRVYGVALDDELTRLGFKVDYTKQDFPDLGILNTELFYCRLPS
jgi:SAM-dependent methyltransferase